MPDPFMLYRADELKCGDELANFGAITRISRLDSGEVELLSRGSEFRFGPETEVLASRTMKAGVFGYGS